MNEKEKKNYLARWNGERGADRNLMNYDRRDDGNHFYHNDLYYEWWYVDCSFDNGYHAIVTFHFRNEFIHPKIPTSQIMIYKPDGSKITKFKEYKSDQCYAGADYCDVRMGNDWLKDIGNGYECHIKIGNVEMNLKLKGIVPGFKFGSGYLYKNEETGLLHGWVIPIPYGEVSAEMILGSEVMQVKGAAYHDHNWGTGSMADIFSGWDWGRIHGKDYTIDFSWCMPVDSDAPILSYLFIARGSDIILSTDIMHAEFSDFSHDDNTGQDYARKIIMTADVKGVKLKLQMNSTCLIESMEIQTSAAWKQYYLRFLADYNMEIEIDGKEDRVSGELLHELMLLNKDNPFLGYK